MVKISIAVWMDCVKLILIVNNSLIPPHTKKCGGVLMGIIIALISGALMSVQGVFNTQVTKATSMWVANCFVQFTALIAGLAMWYFTGHESFTGIAKVTPKYMLL